MLSAQLRSNNTDRSLIFGRKIALRRRRLRTDVWNELIELVVGEAVYARQQAPIERTERLGGEREQRVHNNACRRRPEVAVDAALLAQRVTEIERLRVGLEQRRRPVHGVVRIVRHDDRLREPQTGAKVVVDRTDAGGRYDDVGLFLHAVRQQIFQEFVSNSQTDVFDIDQ